MATTIPDGLPADLRQKFASIRKAQAFSKWMTVLLVLVVVAEFALFTAKTYYPINEGFHDTARVQKAMQDVLPEVQPIIVDTLQKVVKEVAPDYKTQITARFEKVRPALTSKINARFTTLPDQAEKVLGDQLRGTFDRVLAKLEPELKSAFPTLSETQRQDLIVNHFHESVAAKNEALASKIDVIRTNETVKLKALLDSFVLPPDSAMANNEQLNKDLERVLLLMANEMIAERVDALKKDGDPKAAPAAGK